MKQVKVIGVVVGAAVVIFVVISLLNGGWNGRAPVPAAVGFPGAEDGSPTENPNHVTHHPIVVSPRDLPLGTNPAVSSPAANDEWPESPANDPREARPADSFFPGPSVLPIPDRIGTLPAESRSKNPPTWRDDRIPRYPGPSTPSGSLQTLHPTIDLPSESYLPSQR